MTIANGESGFSVRTKLNAALADIQALQDDSAEFEDVPALFDSVVTYAVGTIIRTRKEGFAYEVVSSGQDVTTAGGLKLQVKQTVGGVVSPEMFSKMSTDAERVAGFNAAFAYVVANKTGGASSGDYNIDGTITPNGTYRWEWNNTRLIYNGSTPATDLTEVLENPTGTSSPQGSGKYVIFDTKNCTESINSGRLTIQGSSPGNMRSANRANIPAAVVGITASQSGSAEMVWDTLQIVGCGYGLFQGDQRGTAANILPYTRWSGQYLEIKFCLVGVSGGQSGNCFDDGGWSNIHFTRNEDNGTIRTDFVAKSILYRGLSFSSDNELWTVSESGGTYTSSADHGLSVGDVVAIADGNDNLDASNTIPFVSYVASTPTATTFTVDGTPDNAISGAAVVVNPPSFLVASGDLVAQHIYLEGILDAPVWVFDNGRIRTPDLKVSDGEFGSRYNVGILVAGLNDPTVEVALNQRTGKFNSFLKYLVGVPYLVNGADLNTLTVQVETRNAESDFTEMQIIGGVDLETDHIGSNVLATGLPQSDERNIAVRYTGGWQGYQVCRAGLAFKTFKQDFKNVYGLGANLTANATVQGMTATGNFGTGVIGTTSVSKTAGATGAIAETITMAAGDTIVVDVTATVLSATGFQISLFNGGQTAGDIVVAGPAVRSASTVRAYLTVPAGGADRVGIFGFENAAGTFTDFTAKKIEAS